MDLEFPEQGLWWLIKKSVFTGDIRVIMTRVVLILYNCIVGLLYKESNLSWTPDKLRSVPKENWWNYVFTFFQQSKV